MRKYWLIPITILALSACKSEEEKDSNIKIVVLEQGSNLMSMLTEQGIGSDTFWKIYNAVKPIYSLNKVPPGKEFTLEWVEEDGVRTFDSVRFTINVKTTIHVSRQEDGEFSASKVERPTVKQMLRAEATIDNSLYAAANKVAIPQTTMANLLKAFSWDIDFAQDVKEGDKLNVLYNCEFDKETGERLLCNDILFASMVLSGKTKSLYAYTDKDGKSGYYSEEGFAAKKATEKLTTELEDFQARRRELDSLYASFKPNFVPKPQDILAAIANGSIDASLNDTADDK